MGYTFLSSQTANDDCEIDFTTGIDGTYNEYLFSIVNYKPVTDEKWLTFQVDTGTLTAYDQTMTTTAFYAGHKQDESWYNFAYQTVGDQAQGNDPQRISYSGESNTYEKMTASGQLTLYDPSNGTYVKHFMSRINAQHTGNNTDAQTECLVHHIAGYINTVTAITRVRFAADSGNIQTGTFTLYGVG